MSTPFAKLVAGIGAWVGVLILFAIAGSTLYIVSSVTKPATEPAFSITSVKPENEVYEMGRPVRFVVQGERFRNCPSVIAAFWLTNDGTAWTRFPPLTGGYADLHATEWSFSVAGPGLNTTTGEAPKAGIYRYKALSAPLCDRAAVTETGPIPVCFTIPGEPLPPCAKTS